MNTVLSEYTEQAGRCRQQFAGKPLGTWMANLDGFNEANSWRYIAYLDDTLA